MPLDVSLNQFTLRKLQPAAAPQLALEINVNIPASTTLASGTVLGQLTSSANSVQTLTVTGTPTGGTVTVTATNGGGGIVTFALNFNSSASAAQTAAQAVLGSGNVTVSGGALPGTPLVFTFAGSMAAQFVPAMTVSAAGLTGGTTPAAAFTQTTVGASANTFVAYSSAVIAAPATGPTVVGNGSGSSYGAGTYAVAYTLVTAQGETTPSPATNATVTAAQNLRVSAISSLASTVTRVNYYVNGLWAATTVPTSGTAAQTDITGASLATGQVPPTTNTAFTAPNGAGSHIARAIMSYSVISDSAGVVSLGDTANAGRESYPGNAVPVAVKGVYATQDLIGLDAKAVADLGRLMVGNTTTGLIQIG